MASQVVPESVGCEETRRLRLTRIHTSSRSRVAGSGPTRAGRPMRPMTVAAPPRPGMGHPPLPTYAAPGMADGPEPPGVSGECSCRGMVGV